nr:hypothetical protein [Tanacetum cinerariifolium]
MLHFTVTARIKVQTSGSGNTFLLAVAFFFRQWEVPSGSGNFLTSSGNALCILFPIINQVEHKNTKKSNETYYPRFKNVIIHHFMSKDPSIPRRNKVNWHYVRDDHMNSNAYKEYYAVATGAAPPKPKASVRRTRSSSDTSITPPTTAAGPRLTTTQKGKQIAKAYKAKCLSALSEVGMTEAQQLKLITKRSLQQTHISQASGSGADKGTGADDEGKDGDDDDEDDDGDGDEGDDDDDDQTSYPVATYLFEMELKTILIEKMEGNKSIQCSDEKRNLYKALVEAYESDKIILDTYGETVTLNRRRDDNADKVEEPSAGPD